MKQCSEWFALILNNTIDLPHQAAREFQHHSRGQKKMSMSQSHLTSRASIQNPVHQKRDEQDVWPSLLFPLNHFSIEIDGTLPAKLPVMFISNKILVLKGAVGQ